MARIEALEKKDSERSSVHAPVRATFHTFDVDGESYLQIDTYGSADRATPEKVNQSIQLGAEARSELLELLSRLDQG